jgi:hypothetical protein
VEPVTGSTSKTVNYRSSLLTDKTNLNSPRVRSPLIPPADLPRATKPSEPHLAHRHTPVPATATGRNFSLDRPFSRTALGGSKLRQEVGDEGDSDSDETDSDQDDENNGLPFTSRVMQRYGPTSFGRNKRNGAHKGKLNGTSNDQEGNIKVVHEADGPKDLEGKA